MKERPLLALEAVSVGYRHRRRPERTVLAGVDALVRAGEMVCLLGPNGVGKSTLLRTATATQPPLAGVVRVDGVSVDKISRTDLATMLAVVLTERVDVVNMTVFDLVGMGRYPFTGRSGALNDGDVAAVRSSLSAVAIEHLADREISELSDGERQRTMIARAVAQDPRLLVLDEPTAFLDVTGRVEVIGLLRRLAHDRGMGVLMSTHDPELAIAPAARLWLIDAAGGLVAGGVDECVSGGAVNRAFDTDAFTFDPETGRIRPR